MSYCRDMGSCASNDIEREQLLWSININSWNQICSFSLTFCFIFFLLRSYKKVKKDIQE